MNFVFVSPQFPNTYWNFCDRLRQNGVNVLGIGDTPYDLIAPELKAALTEYYYVPSLEDYDQVFRAMAFFSFKYGKIDWVESNNEYWLPLDARLRTDFNVTTGADSKTMGLWQSKAGMKPLYAKAKVPTARQAKMTTLRSARTFAKKVGFPLFAKPEYGVGSGGAFKIADDEALAAAFETVDPKAEAYVLEEFVPASGIVAYDAILDSNGEPLFENQEEFPPSMSEVATKLLDLVYYQRPEVDPALAELGRATAKGFGLASRFVHMEFFRLAEDKTGLGKKGDYVGLEVNCRPAGGYTPDLINYAHSLDVYRIWADMVTADERRVPDSDDTYFAVSASRRDCHEYAHSHADILARYGEKIVMERPIPDAISDDLGNYMYAARVRTEDELREFVDFVQEQKG